jgi:hypothetical protein
MAREVKHGYRCDICGKFVLVLEGESDDHRCTNRDEITKNIIKNTKSF